METLLLPTAYMPPVIYMALLLKSENIVIETQETYLKQTWRNRCVIMSAQGTLALTIPVVKPNGNRTKTNDVIPDFTQRWQQQHWASITAAYNKAPFFFYYEEELKSLILNTECSLLRYNSTLLAFFLNALKIKKTISFTTDYKHLPALSDLRLILSPKKTTPFSLTLLPAYYQVFSDRFPFFPNLSILDLLVNLGQESLDYLQRIEKQIEFKQ